MSEEASLDGVRHAGNPLVEPSQRNGGTVRSTTHMKYAGVAANWMRFECL